MAQRESSYISLRPSISFTSSIVPSRQSSLFNALNGFDNIDQQLPIEDMKTINRIRKNGKLIFQKQSNGPAPMKDLFVFSIYNWKDNMHIMIDEVKISASGFLKSIAKEKAGWTRSPSTTHVDAETYINDEDAKEETKALLGEEFTNEIVQFIQKNLKSE